MVTNLLLNNNDINQEIDDLQLAYMITLEAAKPHFPINFDEELLHSGPRSDLMVSRTYYTLKERLTAAGLADDHGPEVHRETLSRP